MPRRPRKPCASPLRRGLAASALLAGTLLAASPALAEMELSFYTGFQEAAHSRVRGNDVAGSGEFNFLATWEGRSFEMPPYYGLRFTWWQNENLGFGVEFNHAKVYASDRTMADNGFDTLELTNGLNIFTANVMYRWPGGSAFTPYVGAGIGFNVPHVEVQTTGPKTFEFQFGGLSAAILAGVSYSLNENWALFGEVRSAYSKVDADLKGGGNLRTNIVTNAVNIGVSYRF